MSGSQTSQFVLKLNGTNVKSSTLGNSIGDVLALDYSFSLASGVGANQASNFFSDQRTLAPSASEDLDLAGILTNSFGVVLTFTKIKLVSIKAAAANVNDVVVGGAASNGFISWVGAATHTVKVRPGGLLILAAPDVNGYAVTAATADLLHVANSAGSTSVTYDIVLVGTD